MDRPCPCLPRVGDGSPPPPLTKDRIRRALLRRGAPVPPTEASLAEHERYFEHFVTAACPPLPGPAPPPRLDAARILPLLSLFSGQQLKTLLQMFCNQHEALLRCCGPVAGPNQRRLRAELAHALAERIGRLSDTQLAASTGAAPPLMAHTRLFWQKHLLLRWLGINEHTAPARQLFNSTQPETRCVESQRSRSREMPFISSHRSHQEQDGAEPMVHEPISPVLACPPAVTCMPESPLTSNFGVDHRSFAASTYMPSDSLPLSVTQTASSQETQSEARATADLYAACGRFQFTVHAAATGAAAHSEAHLSYQNSAEPIILVTEPEMSTSQAMAVGATSDVSEHKSEVETLATIGTCSEKQEGAMAATDQEHLESGMVIHEAVGTPIQLTDHTTSMSTIQVDRANGTSSVIAECDRAVGTPMISVDQSTSISVSSNDQTTSVTPIGVKEQATDMPSFSQLDRIPNANAVKGVCKCRDRESIKLKGETIVRTVEGAHQSRNQCPQNVDFLNNVSVELTQVTDNHMQVHTMQPISKITQTSSTTMSTQMVDQGSQAATVRQIHQATFTKHIQLSDRGTVMSGAQLVLHSAGTSTTNLPETPTKQSPQKQIPSPPKVPRIGPSPASAGARKYGEGTVTGTNPNTPDPSVGCECKKRVAFETKNKECRCCGKSMDLEKRAVHSDTPRSELSPERAQTLAAAAAKSLPDIDESELMTPHFEIVDQAIIAETTSTMPVAEPKSGARTEGENPKTDGSKEQKPRRRSKSKRRYSKRTPKCEGNITQNDEEKETREQGKPIQSERRIRSRSKERKKCAGKPTVESDNTDIDMVSVAVGTSELDCVCQYKLPQSSPESNQIAIKPRLHNCSQGSQPPIQPVSTASDNMYRFLIREYSWAKCPGHGSTTASSALTGEFERTLTLSDRQRQRHASPDVVSFAGGVPVRNTDSEETLPCEPPLAHQYIGMDGIEDGDQVQDDGTSHSLAECDRWKRPDGSTDGTFSELAHTRLPVPICRCCGKARSARDHQNAPKNLERSATFTRSNSQPHLPYTGKSKSGPSEQNGKIDSYQQIGKSSPKNSQLLPPSRPFLESQPSSIPSIQNSSQHFTSARTCSGPHLPHMQPSAADTHPVRTSSVQSSATTGLGAHTFELENQQYMHRKRQLSGWEMLLITRSQQFKSDSTQNISKQEGISPQGSVYHLTETCSSGHQQNANTLLTHSATAAQVQAEQGQYVARSPPAPPSASATPSLEYYTPPLHCCTCTTVSRFVSAEDMSIDGGVPLTNPPSSSSVETGQVTVCEKSLNI